jgi:hypothetical protein
MTQGHVFPFDLADRHRLCTYMDIGHDQKSSGKENEKEVTGSFKGAQV